MKQLIPDWSIIATKGKISQNYNFPFTYKGPGLYLTKTDTIIIQEDDSGYLHVNCYNCPLYATVWSEKLSVCFDNRE